MPQSSLHPKNKSSPWRVHPQQHQSTKPYSHIHFIRPSYEIENHWEINNNNNYIYIFGAKSSKLIFRVIPQPTAQSYNNNNIRMVCMLELRQFANVLKLHCVCVKYLSSWCVSCIYFSKTSFISCHSDRHMSFPFFILVVTQSLYRFLHVSTFLQ